ncbi:hypothetical protein TKK_0001537 [Trichogramma kaykai]|uniref:Replication factor C subunit 1 n=1 Tax=Trichogramma kaykai TaxID=54128 RepID=A0ABD2X2M2_9HYME
MPQDIRSFFARQSSSSAVTQEKSRRKPPRISDEENSSPSKVKKAKHNDKSKDKEVKSRSKKRTIESSDEDDVKTVNVKKAKIEDSSKKVEIIEDPSSVFNKKPVKRINSTKVTKKESQKTEAKKSSKHPTAFEDDDFDATLNQLDTSQIEDEYLNSLKDDEKEHNKSGKKDKGSPENKKNENSKVNKDNVHCDVKTKDSSKKISKKDPHPKLEVEKSSKITKDKKKNDEYNEIIEENIEKKKQHAALYQNYLHRGGARNPGSKDVPEGAEQCFANLSFLITGVLESLEREEIEEIIKKYGGKILTTVSKKLNYLIVGDQPGPSKMTKANSLGVKQIDEDQFLNLLRTLPGNKVKIDNSKIQTNQQSPKVKINEENKSSITPIDSDKNESIKVNHKSPSKKIELMKISKVEIKKEELPKNLKLDTLETASNKNLKVVETKVKIEESPQSTESNIARVTALVEKYRPKDMKQIIGQNGDKSNAKKLFKWLSNWYKYHGCHATEKGVKTSWKDDSGITNKAALLSGPPGVGKTTTAYVVCAQLGLEILEFNASDTRSKKSLQDEISSILSNKTVKTLFSNTTDKSNATKPKHVLLMDEVDGMAGNEDRGGMQELISLIKATEIPIICICNDRASQKIKSLANYTFDLRFQKPRVELIRAAMMSLCFKEGIKITPDELSQIINSTNQDIRQVINHLSMMSASKQKSEQNYQEKLKNLKLGPWDVIHKVFSCDEHKNMKFRDKSDLFFHDYNIAPLFVYENYPMVRPNAPRSELLARLSKASSSLAIGDTIEKAIRSNQSWSLLPVQAVFSSVIPGTVMSGHMGVRPNFPSWLGRNSKSNKFDRLLQELTLHIRLTTGASKESVNLDYIKMLVNSILTPLINDGENGIDQAVAVMNEYHLSREDLDSLIELTQWPHTRDPMQTIPSKLKAAFTKAYNKNAQAFSNTGTTTKKKSARENKDDEYTDGNDEPLSDENEEDEKIENDKLIKAKTSKAKSAPSKAKTTAKTSKPSASKTAKKPSTANKKK